MCIGSGYEDKNIKENRPGKIISYIRYYYELSFEDQQKILMEIHHDLKNQNLNFQQLIFKLLLVWLSLRTAMVYPPSLCSLAVGKNRTNFTPTINFLFLFLRKPIMIVVKSTMRLTSVMVQTYSGSLGCNL